MDPNRMKEILIDALRETQDESDQECPPITGATKPTEELPAFDSKVWPVAISILVEKTGVTIPDDMNIFIDEATKEARSVDEIASFLCDTLKSQSGNEKAVA